MATQKTDSQIDIPIERRDSVVFEGSMTSVKKKFTAEMKKMDEEMKKLNSDTLHVHAPSQSSLRAAVTNAEESFQRPTHSKVQGTWTWDALIRSPLVEGEGENKRLKLQFDVSQFEASEVTVKIHDGTLIISATHEENNDTTTIVRQFFREFKFPKGVNPTSVISNLSKDGVLTVMAPLPQPEIDESIKSSIRED